MEIVAKITETKRVSVDKQELIRCALDNLSLKELEYLIITKKRRQLDIPDYWYIDNGQWKEDYDHGHYSGSNTIRELTKLEKQLFIKEE